MDAGCRAFVDELLGLHASLRPVVDAALEDWAPGEPPVTTLFAALGRRLARDVGATGAERAAPLFARLERGMVDGDEALRTAIATGLIEALAITAQERPALWRRIRGTMGPACRAHADAWIGGDG